MNAEIRKPLIVVAGVLAVLLLISVVFSGRPGDAVYTGPQVRAELDPDVLAAEQEEADALAAAEAEEAEDDAAPEDAVVDVTPDDADETVEDATETEQAEAEGVETPTDALAEELAEEATDDATQETATADQAPAEDAVTEDAAADEAPADEEVTTAAITGDASAGASVFRQCAACHQVGDNAANRVGPVLNGLIDRPKGSIDGFRYSNAMQAAAADGGVWDVEALRGYLADPRGFMPGTSMAFAGVRNETDLDNLIAYLATYDD